VWGIGVTAIEFLTGDPPFYTFEPMAAIFRIANKTLKSEVELPENVPSGLKSLIWSCLEKESSKRPSVEELLLHEVFRE
jgi:serine/threonine protein kinase